tara:strand:+ start:1474 stop:2139 length:666 start_codon:yes stop_codon:yes gene_type:complete
VFCVECGKEIPNGVKFCPDCGASQIEKVEEKTPKKKKPTKAKPKKGKTKKVEESEKKNESIRILMYSIPGFSFLLITIILAYIANSTPLEPIGTINGETVYNGACSSFTYGCIEIAFYGLCVAITNVFFAFALVKKPETSQTIFSVVILVGVLLGLGAVFLGSGIVLQIQTIGICGSVLTIAIVFIAINSNESMIEAAGHAWLMLTVLGAIFAITAYLIIF